MNINDKEILIIIIFILTSVCFMLYIKLKAEKKQCERIAKENRKLIADNALLDAEHLKFQLQPHTLNNILANLKVIASKLNKGIDSLSETLDYILYKGNTHLVSVQEEINFIKKYLALNDLFISEIDSIKLIDSQVNRNSKYFDSACFLKIELKLSATAFEMNVVNRIRQKPIEANGGIGLNNMRKRLDLLLTGKFEIASSSNEQEYYSSLIIHF